MTVILLLTLIDGSNLNVHVDAQSSLRVETKHGILQIKAEDIDKIEAGVHVDDYAKVASVAEDLVDESYKKRANADQFMRAWYRQCYPKLLQIAASKDAEGAARAAAILRDRPKYRIGDTLWLRDGSIIKGNIIDNKIRCTCQSLGDVQAVFFSQIDSVQANVVKKHIDISVDDGWVEVGRVVQPIAINATGEIDIWPQSLGQYVASPDGSNVNNGFYPSGALIGRVDGKEFLVGRHFKAETLRGKLEIRVNPAPPTWQPQLGTLGSYQVEVE